MTLARRATKHDVLQLDQRRLFSESDRLRNSDRLRSSSRYANAPTRQLQDTVTGQRDLRRRRLSLRAGGCPKNERLCDLRGLPLDPR
jgi:hypothetical protein